MKYFSTALLVLVTVINVIVAFYVINQPVTNIENYKMYSDAVQKCSETTSQNTSAEPIGISI